MSKARPSQAPCGAPRCAPRPRCSSVTSRAAWLAPPSATSPSRDRCVLRSPRIGSRGLESAVAIQSSSFVAVATMPTTALRDCQLADRVIAWRSRCWREKTGPSPCWAMTTQAEATPPPSQPPTSEPRRPSSSETTTAWAINGHVFAGGVEATRDRLCGGYMPVYAIQVGLLV